MISLYTYLNIKFLPGHHMLYHNIMSSHHMLNKEKKLLFQLIKNMSNSNSL
ncbi:hypothetical protein O3M35_009176 [Rhynocoris fuscipes]|uniref:Uncharacterized protein n=1 Tax=Rhynocoris fuscipes TaxID=488301 RepID=A0AAW1D476_9HEMI